MKPSEILREAKHVLFERGWHQGSVQGNDGSVCIQGAIGVASCGVATRGLTHDARMALGVLNNHVIFTASSIWNDADGRTFSEVIDVLDRAEKFAEQAEQ